MSGASGVQVAWTHRCIGDYDHNGEVNINDLTPIGVHYHATPAVWGWDAAQAADGDGNGEVNIGDITPIGQNYHVRTVAYNVYGSTSLSHYPSGPDDPNGSGARLAGSVNLDDFVDLHGSRQLTCAVTAPVPGEVYWVRPSDGATDGAASNYTAGALGGDWRMQGREPRHQGRSPFFGPRDNHVAWTYTAGDSIAGGPAVRGDGVIYFGSNDQHLHAVRPDGTPEWPYAAGNWIWATPAIGLLGVVYFGCEDNYLYAANHDGSPRWRVDLGDDVFSPTIGEDGTVYVGTNGGDLCAVDPAGAVDWAFPTGDAIHGSPAVGPDGAIYTGNYAGNLYAIEPGGSERWHFTAPDEIRYSPTLGENGTVYVGCNDRNVYAITPAGAEAWHFRTEGEVDCGIAIGADGAIYTGGSGGNLLALELDGALRWQYNARTSIHTTPAIGADGMVYFGDTSGNVTALNPDGTLHWTYDAGSGIGSDLALGADGMLFACTDDGLLVAFGGGTGGTAGGVESVEPLDGISGATITLRAITFGTPPLTYAWDFGDGAEPLTSSAQAPSITLGAPGQYPASVTVSNAFGPAVALDFTLFVYPSEPSTDGWVHSWGSAGDDAFRDVAVADDGSIYAAGFTYANSSRDGDALVAHYSATGELLAAWSWGQPWFDMINAIAVGPSGDIYCCGIIENDMYESDILLLRFNSEGEVLWQQAWDGGDYDECEGLYLAPSGEVYLAGSTSTGANYNIVWMSWDASGAFQGASLIDLSDDAGFCLEFDGDSMYLGGSVEGSGEGSRDMLLIKLQPDKTLDWAVTYGTPVYESIYGIQLDASSNVYVGGSRGAMCSFTSAGALNWARRWSGTRDQVYEMLVLDGSRLYVAGTDWSSPDGDDLVALLGDTSGDLSWSYAWVAAYPDDYGSACALTPEGRLCLTGGTAHAYGSWQALGVTAQDYGGTLHSVTPIITDSLVVPVTLDGTVAQVTGTTDTGGGGEDAIIFSWDFPD